MVKLVKGQPDRTRCHAAEFHCFLDRYRVGIDEHRPEERRELIMEVESGLEVTLTERLEHGERGQRGGRPGGDPALRPAGAFGGCDEFCMAAPLARALP